MFNKIKRKFIDWLLEKEEITIGELYNRYEKNKCEIYDEDSGELKFIEYSIPDGLYVESENNEFLRIKKILKTVEYETWKLTTGKGLTLEGADEHLVIKENYETCHIDKLTTEDKIRTKFGIDVVKSVINKKTKENMFDLELEEDSSHMYYTNNILSHNTTTTAAFILFFVMFSQSKNVAIVANKQQSSKEIIDRIKLMYENLPMWLKPGVTEYNKHTIAFENGCKIMAYATSASAIRGLSIALLYLDEFAFVPHNLVEPFIESTFPVISSSVLARIIISSTPKGKNHFYTFYRDALEGKSTFKPFSIEWNEIPGRDLQWRSERIAELGSQEKFDQEYGGEFIDATNLLLSPTILQYMENVLIKEPITKSFYDSKANRWWGDPTNEATIIDFYRGIKIWENPLPNHNYVMVVDVSEGKQQDSTAFIIVDVTHKPFKIVLTYQNNDITTVELPQILVNVAKQYNEAYMLVENNSVGHSVVNDVFYDFEYENMINLDYESENRVKKKKYFELGVRTTKKVKKQGALNMKNMIETHAIEFYDKRLLYELYAFIKHPTKGFCADDGNHDDLVMCLILFSFLSKVKNYFEHIRTGDKINPEENKKESLGGFAFVEGDGANMNSKKRSAQEADDMLLRFLME
jgi:hypothetical protein